MTNIVVIQQNSRLEKILKVISSNSFIVFLKYEFFSFSFLTSIGLQKVAKMKFLYILYSASTNINTLHNHRVISKLEIKCDKMLSTTDLIQILPTDPQTSFSRSTIQTSFNLGLFLSFFVLHDTDIFKKLLVPYFVEWSSFATHSFSGLGNLQW